MSAEVRISIVVDDREFDFEQEHPLCSAAQPWAHGTDAARRMLSQLVEQVRAALDLVDAQDGRTDRG